MVGLLLPNALAAVSVGAGGRAEGARWASGGCVVSGGRLLAVSFVVSASLLSSSGSIGGLAGPDVIEGLPIAAARDATAPDSQVDFNGDGYADLALTADDSYDD